MKYDINNLPENVIFEFFLTQDTIKEKTKKNILRYFYFLISSLLFLIIIVTCFFVVIEKIYITNIQQKEQNNCIK